MIAVIISGGEIEREFARAFIEKCEDAEIYAVDKGLLFCYEQGIRPDCIIGDFDSLPDGILTHYEADTDILIKRLMPEKDDSDSECAMHLAIERGARTIYLLGGTGNRIDHVMANIQLLSYTCIRGIPMYLADAHNLAVVLNGGITIRREEQFGEYVSFFALTDHVPDLTLTGFKYPLANYRLTNTSCGLTLSNEIVEEEASVSFSEGLLLMIQSRD